MSLVAVCVKDPDTNLRVQAWLTCSRGRGLWSVRSLSWSSLPVVFLSKLLDLYHGLISSRLVQLVQCLGLEIVATPGCQLNADW